MVVTYGRGRALIVATGMQSELGKIIRLVKSVNFWGPHQAELGEQACVGLAERIDVAPVRTHHLDAARRRHIDDGALGRRYPGEQVRANLANQTFANPAPHGAREVPGLPIRLRVLANGPVSERLCWRPIQARAISQTAFEAWGRP